jgi:hypothetical protein
VECDFFDFGKSNYTFNVVEPAGGTAITLPTSIQSYIEAVTLGINYRFNGTGS